MKTDLILIVIVILFILKHLLLISKERRKSMAYFQKTPSKNKQGYKWKCTEEGPRNPATGKRTQITRRADTKKRGS